MFDLWAFPILLFLLFNCTFRFQRTNGAAAGLPSPFNFSIACHGCHRYKLFLPVQLVCRLVKTSMLFSCCDHS